MTGASLLGGMRVVEAAAFVAAPLGGMTLAQMGADVIRIDPLGGGLDRHRWPLADSGTSLFWTGLNRSKRSVALDLASDEGRELAMALVTAPGDDAGVLITNFPPRGWLDHDALRARRADLIQITLQGDRHGGSAVDYTVNARVGLPAMTGPAAVEDDAGVVNHVLPAWDLIAGQTVALGLLAAERHRRRTGAGQHVRLALEDVALAAMAQLGFVAEAAAGRPRERHGNELFGAFGRDFVCSDGVRVMVVGLTLKQWRALCEALSLASAMRELGARLGLDLDREGDRFAARREIASMVAACIAARPFVDVAAAFEGRGVCWSRYRSIDEVVRDDPSCSVANPMFASIEQPDVGTVLAPGIPLDFGAVPRRPPTPAPRLGAQTEVVLHEVLGIDAAVFGRMVARGVVGVA